MRHSQLLRLAAVALLGLASACKDSTGPNNVPKPRFSIDVAGTGSGAISSSQLGLNCNITQGSVSGTCIVTVDSGSTISLSAAAASDWELQSWSGAPCAAAALCEFVVTRNVSVRAGSCRPGGAGKMKLLLSNAAAGTGALIVTVTGASVTAVTPSPGFQSWFGASGQNSVRILIRGNIGLGALAELQVANRNATFTVTINEATAGASGGYTPISPGTYVGSVVRP